MRREISTGHKHGEKVTHRTSKGREIQAEGTACAKALGLDSAVFEEHRGGLCSCSRVSKEERGRRGGQGGDRQVMQGLVGLGVWGRGHLGFNSKT